MLQTLTVAPMTVVKGWVPPVKHGMTEGIYGVVRRLPVTDHHDVSLHLLTLGPPPRRWKEHELCDPIRVQVALHPYRCACSGVLPWVPSPVLPGACPVRSPLRAPHALPSCCPHLVSHIRVPRGVKVRGQRSERRRLTCRAQRSRPRPRHM